MRLEGGSGNVALHGGAQASAHVESQLSPPHVVGQLLLSIAPWPIKTRHRDRRDPTAPKPTGCNSPELGPLLRLFCSNPSIGHFVKVNFGLKDVFLLRIP